MSLNDEKLINVLVVGQTPPPYMGQAVMTQIFLDGKYKRLRLHHIRMSYSAEMSEIGRFNLRKISHLFELICLTYLRRLTTGANYLYYPPAGPNLVPLFRDVIFLLSTRWLFRGTIFHYHAAGVSERIATLPFPLRFLSRLAYRNAECSIRISQFNPDDPTALNSTRSFEIPNAVPDMAGQFGNTVARQVSRSDRVPRLLFVGVLNESKGTLVLLDAIALLLQQGYRFEADLVGEIENPVVRAAIEQRLTNASLKQAVTFHGRLVGDAKWALFRSADLFVFPTFFESESFGLVLIEAMQFGIPVVATQWRGVQSVVVDGETGFLVPIRDPGSVAEKVAKLLDDPTLADQMGAAGRARFLKEYTLDRFWERIEAAIVNTALVPVSIPNVNHRRERA